MKKNIAILGIILTLATIGRVMSQISSYPNIPPGAGSVAVGDITGLGSGVAALLATFSSANLRTALTDETGTGVAYFQGGDIGTPSAGVGTNFTGIPISTGISGLASNMATFLGTSTSANFASAITDEIGSGRVGFFPASSTVPSVATYLQGLVSTQLGGTDASTGLVAATINTTETGFDTTYQIPADSIVSTKGLRVTWYIDNTTSGTPVTQRGRIRLGGSVGASPSGTIVYDVGAAITPTANQTSRSFKFECLILGTAASGASVNVETMCGAASGVASMGGFGGANTIAQPVAIATNAANNIVMSITFGGNTAGNVLKMRAMTVEAINF